MTTRLPILVVASAAIACACLGQKNAGTTADKDGQVDDKGLADVQLAEDLHVADPGVDVEEMPDALPDLGDDTKPVDVAAADPGPPEIAIDAPTDIGPPPLCPPPTLELEADVTVQPEPEDLSEPLMSDAIVTMNQP